MRKTSFYLQKKIRQHLNATLQLMHEQHQYYQLSEPKRENEAFVCNFDHSPKEFHLLIYLILVSRDKQSFFKWLHHNSYLQFIFFILIIFWSFNYFGICSNCIYNNHDLLFKIFPFSCENHYWIWEFGSFFIYFINIFTSAPPNLIAICSQNTSPEIPLIKTLLENNNL